MRDFINYMLYQARIFTVIILFFSIRLTAFAQIFPKENSTLNYRMIGFSFQSKQGISNSNIEIALGNHTNEKEFNENKIITTPVTGNKIIREVPSFGKEYTWRVRYKPGISNSPFYHFKTGTTHGVDSGFNRMFITEPATQYKDACFFVDNINVLYNMKGQPIWYLPFIEGNHLPANNLMLTPQGTITFLANDRAYEVSYDGAILWKGPDFNKIEPEKEHYHHEFIRLKNGHYMLLGTRFLSCHLLPDSSFTLEINKHDNVDLNTSRLPFGTILEYDKDGNKVWSWESSKHYNDIDINNHKTGSKHPYTDIHENAFYFDEKRKVIYLSLKHVNRIIKIKYPEGTVIGEFGGTGNQMVPGTDEDLFCGQHSIKRLTDGGLVLFNNNSCNHGVPVIQKFKDPEKKTDKVMPVWEYECQANSRPPNGFLTGGSVMELSGNSLFVSMALPDNKLFIVNMEKKILWSASNEYYDSNQNKWAPLGMYRAFIFENKQLLDRLIWNSEKPGE